jgi:hypothetical protein
MEDDGDALVENETIIFQNRHKAIGMQREIGRILVRALVQIHEGKLVVQPDLFDDMWGRD